MQRLVTVYPRKCSSGLRKASSSSSWSSATVRETFLNYFESNSHCSVPSSSIIPTKWRNQSPLPFVNAGMVRWRPLFTNEIALPSRFESGVVNSQKCVRVGGKLCDLDQVGHDGHHHTFFEMLGSWAFNNTYGRGQSIQLAWKLLTEGYGLSKDRLYVTYFGGCEKLGLPADIATKEEWLALGLNPHHVIPFGSADNFWQMGLEGPCGPCTEIHFSHLEKGGQHLVNKPNQADVVEIWNLVFIEHFLKLSSGQLEPLDQQHVDTGMGLERLTATLNGSRSNYDTDLFQPHFEVIRQFTGQEPYQGTFSLPLDTAYRQLADHARMVTVCMSDGLLPDASPKMRNVLRRSFQVIKERFGINEAEKCADLMFHLSSSVKDTLKFHFPVDDDGFEQRQADIIRSVLDFEAHHLQTQTLIENKAMENILKKHPKVAESVDPWEANITLEVFKQFDRRPNGIVDGVVDGDLSFRIVDSLGVSSEQLKRISSLYGVELDEEALEIKKTEAKLNSKQKTAAKASPFSSSKLENVKAPVTDDHWKYHYSKMEPTKYSFPLVQAEVLKIVQFDDGARQAILLNTTCCYGEAGGQEGDRGTILGLDGQTLFTIDDTQLLPVSNSNAGHHVWHIGNVAIGRQLKEKTRVKVKFDISRRIRLMQNHTGTHLLNCVLSNMFQFASQKSSHIHADGFKFDFTALNAAIDAATVAKIEEQVNSYINMCATVDQITVDNPEASFESDTKLHAMLTEEFPNKKVIIMPEETYPGELTLISLPDSIEPCCGTHVLDTSDVQGFVITSVKSTHPGQKSLKCLTGQKALDAREAGLALVEAMIDINQQLASATTEEAISNIGTSVKVLLKKTKEGSKNLPFAVRMEASQILTELAHHIQLLHRKQTADPKSRQKN